MVKHMAWILFVWILVCLTAATIWIAAVRLKATQPACLRFHYEQCGVFGIDRCQVCNEYEKR
jgi:hypothetical protein